MLSKTDNEKMQQQDCSSQSCSQHPEQPPPWVFANVQPAHHSPRKKHSLIRLKEIVEYARQVQGFSTKISSLFTKSEVEAVIGSTSVGAQANDSANSDEDQEWEKFPPNLPAPKLKQDSDLDLSRATKIQTNAHNAGSSTELETPQKTKKIAKSRLRRPRHQQYLC